MDEERDQDQIDANLDVCETDRILDSFQAYRIGETSQVGRRQESEDEPAERAREGLWRAYRPCQDHDGKHEHGGEPCADKHQVGDDPEGFGARLAAVRLGFRRYQGE
jgi:hypothetical protein